jgi:3-hydroxy-9,10-secoandrosta-1,3,5(10)-triene-9,17-dione monooxygenase reductase component
LCDDRSVSESLEAQELRTLMSRWTTGVAVVTSRGDNGPRGATTNALTSLSLNPPLLLVCLDNGSNTLDAVRTSRRFCVNILAAGQEEIARRFATKQSGEEKLAGVLHEVRADGVPALGGTLAWVVCELEREHEGGDHAILIGRPLQAGVDPHAEPLVFFAGGFHEGIKSGSPSSG